MSLGSNRLEYVGEKFFFYFLNRKKMCKGNKEKEKKSRTQNTFIKTFPDNIYLHMPQY